MDALFDIVINNFKEINWSGSAIFVVIILVILLIFRKWSMLLLILLTIVLGWGAQDLIITNLQSELELISVPLVIYCVGGGTVLVLALISFFKSSI